MTDIKAGGWADGSKESVEQLLNDANSGGIVEVGEPIREADILPNGYPQPGSPANTCGIIAPCTKPAPTGADSEPPIAAETENEKSFLKSKKDGIDQSIDDWVERQGFSQGAMVAGALGKALNEVFFPTDATEVAMSVAGGPAIKAAAKFKKQVGGWIKGKRKGKADDACSKC